MELPKHYNSKESEERWHKFWESEGIFEFDTNDKSSEKYLVDTPPPTVSGNMHIGHAFSYSQQDFIVRYKRMKGYNVFYPFGTDDNGLPTERLVEKLKKVKSTRMARADFIKLCQDTLLEIKPEFIKNWKKIGQSCDFTKSYSTIGKHAIKTSQKSFLDLYNKNLVYQKEAPSMWCVNCQTAIAQAELEDKEIPSKFNNIKFKIKETNEDIIIGTTRPELLPACVCIFVNPKDERYSNLIGKTAIVPLFGQEVKIYEDESAQIDKGTGILMICSYGDRFDVDAINRYKLEPRICFTKYGTLNELGGDFKDLKIKEAREKILDKLNEESLLVSQKDIVHAVNVHDKCGTEIEFLTTKQWFINIIDNKDRFLVAGNQIDWHPEQMKVRYDNWVKNLNWDWCISRQRHFGVPFPVWYDKEGNVIIANEDDLPIDPEKQVPEGYSFEDLTPEMDVMDTWATSSVSPQIVANWIKDEDSEKYNMIFEESFPMTLRPQAHDIIRTWAFYTIVKSLYHNNSIPWKEIVISGNVSDPKGQKMSKSKGNVVDPAHIIEKYSADALRFWAAGSKLGEDLNYNEKDLVTGQKTVTKLWNASKFALMHLEDYDSYDKEELRLVDRWALSKLNKLIKFVTGSFDNYQYSRVKLEVDTFFWSTFCEFYLEIVKDRLYNPEVWGVEARKAGQYTLYTLLSSILKMFAPFMPFITEEIYSLYFSEKDKNKSIHISKWPLVDESLNDEKSEIIGDLLIKIIQDVRKAKTEKKLSMKAPIQIMRLKAEVSADDFEQIEMEIEKVLSVKDIEFQFGKYELELEFEV